MNSDVIMLVESARFELTRFREGYNMEDVDRLLDEVSSIAGQLDPEELSALPQKIINAKFTVTKFREGYDMIQVDDFLDSLVSHTQTLIEKQDNSASASTLGATESAPTAGVAPIASSKFEALRPILNVEFPATRSDGYAKKDVDSFVAFLSQLNSGTNTYTVAEALQVAEHLSPKPSGLFASGYDRQHVDAFTARVVGLLKTL